MVRKYINLSFCYLFPFDFRVKYDLDHFNEIHPKIYFDTQIHLRVFHFCPSFYHKSFINAFIKPAIFTISLNLQKLRRRGVSPSKATAASLKVFGTGEALLYETFPSLMIPGLQDHPDSLLGSVYNRPLSQRLTSLWNTSSWTANALLSIPNNI